MAGVNTPKSSIISKKRFGTPVVVLGTEMTSNAKKTISVDAQVGTYLEERRKRILDEAQTSELELATESNKRDAARIRKEKELIERTGEGEEVNDMANSDKKAEDAAEVAATAVSQGADPETAMNLARGGKKVIVVTAPKPAPAPDPSTVKPTIGGWIVVQGLPVRDPEGEYTFVQALQVAELSKKPVNEANTELSQLLQEIRQQNQNKQDAVLQAVMETNKAILTKLSEPAKPAENNNPRPGIKTRVFIPDHTNGRWVPQEFEPGETVILPPVPMPVDNGKDVALIAEENRHKERMTEIGAENEKKVENRKLVGEVVDSLATIAGAAFTGGKSNDKPASQSTPEIEHMTCETCHKDIPFNSGAKEIVCPHCNAKYIEDQQAPNNPTGPQPSAPETNKPEPRKTTTEILI
jgi:predicted RNA-binding Zn-ribbon protein involved in translation (DUF1610 family)